MAKYVGDMAVDLAGDMDKSRQKKSRKIKI
jgi:hypothetical protein